MPNRPGRPPSLKLPTEPLPAGPISKAVLARLLNIERSRINTWCGDGTLSAPAVTDAGLIMPAEAIAQLRSAGKFANSTSRQTCREVNVLKSSSIEDDLVPSPPIGGDGEAAAAADAVARVAAGAPLSYDEARTANETLKAHESLLSLRQRRGELIEASKADAVAFVAARALRDGLQALPARVVPEMAARLGIEPAALLSELSAAIRLFLSEIAQPTADWRQGLTR